MTTVNPKPKKEAKPKRPPGRPSSYSPELADRICEKIAISDKGLHRICAENPEFPEPETIRAWKWRHPEFAAKYARAKEEQQEWIIEGAVDIADDGSNDTYIDEECKPRVDHDHIQRSKLRVDTRKWVAARLARKRFGDKVDVNHGGQADNPIQALYQQITGTPMKPSED